MFYLQHTINIGSVLNPVMHTNFWQFESKRDRDGAVLAIHTAYPAKKMNIAKGTPIKKFSHFKELCGGSCVRMIEKEA